MTRQDFAASWDARAGNSKTGYGLGSWTSFNPSGSYTPWTSPIPKTGTEDNFLSIDYSAHEMTSIALAMFPTSVTYANSRETGELLQTMLSIFNQNPSTLRGLGITLPLNDYSQLDGVNACTYFSDGTDFWVRLVQVSDDSHQYYLYVRAATAAEKQAGLALAKGNGPTTPTSEYAYPPLGPEAFASFAPPMSSTPDTSGNPAAGITAIPSLVILMTNPAWARPFVATVTPMPDGTTIYRSPADDGTPRYTLTNPFNAAQMAGGVDLLTFLGSDNSLRGYPVGIRMIRILEFAANTATGEGLFYIDGQRSECSWVGGLVQAPKRGALRESVKPQCTG